MPDPWAVLGLGPGSSLEEARAARRRLAKQLHPDLHAARPAAERAELTRRMAQVNLAIAELEAVAPVPTEAVAQPAPAAAALSADSFAVEALPVEAFETLFLAGYNLGEVLVADEPCTLELYLPGPPPCFCLLSLAPEAGGSIVTLDLTAAEDAESPDTESVRDALVSELNRLAGSARP
jgi:hypothetical protein